MKRQVILLTFLTILLVTVTAFAKVDLGVIGGIHNTTHIIVPDPGFEEKTRTEFGAGLFFNVPFHKCLSVQIQGMYLRKGSDLRIVGFDEDVKTVAEYLEFPVFLRYTFNFGKVRPYYFAGPSIGFLLSAKHMASFIPEEYEDAKNDSKAVELSLGVGGGIQILLDKVSLYGQIQYLHGLTNIDNVELEGDHSESIYSRGISYMIGVSIPIGKK